MATDVSWFLSTELVFATPVASGTAGSANVGLCVLLNSFETSQSEFSSSVDSFCGRVRKRCTRCSGKLRIE